MHDKLVEQLTSIRLNNYMNSTAVTDGQRVETDIPNTTARLYNSINTLLSAMDEYYKSEPTGEQITIDPTSIDDAEFEIYEEEAVYETFIQQKNADSTEELLIASGVTKDSTDAFMNKILSVNEIAKLVREAAGDENTNREYIVESVNLYQNPIYQTTGDNKTIDNVNNITEYSQFLSTIQGQRNLIQRKLNADKEVLIKFTQTARGTFFEILGKEPESTGDNVLNGSIAGFYVSKGYQAAPLQGTAHQIPSIPRGGRYNRKIARKTVKTTDLKAAPGADTNSEDWRITIVPNFYEGEPLDWNNDNYYTTFLFAQNADNLNIQLDPEFEARNKVIFTTDTTDETKRLEQEMIGYFVARPKV